MAGGHHTRRTALKGHSIRKVENHWFRASCQTTNNNNKKHRKHLIMEAALCHSVSHRISLCHTSSLVNVRYNESLLWFEIFGFCDTINIGSSLGLLLVILSCPVSWRSCKFQTARLAPSTAPFIDEIDLGMGHLRALNLGLDDR